MNGSSANLRVSRRLHDGYTLLIVIVVLAVVSIFAGVLMNMASVAVGQTRLSECRELTRWAADAAVEEALWRLARGSAADVAAASRFVTASNDCSVEVAVAPVGPGTFRIEAQSVYAPEGRDDIRMPARSRVVAGVTADAATGRLRISSWTEGWPGRRR